MHKVLLAFCVSDEVYCDRLSQYLAGQHREHTEIRIFSDPECFRESMEKTDYHAVLLEERFLEAVGAQSGITRYILLNDGEVPEKWRELPTIYKYQSVDNILREVFGLIGENGPEEGIFTGSKELIGIFSPHGHDLQMAFSLGLAEILAENRRVLYLNLMDCAGFSEQFEQTYPADISDLLYFARSGGERFYRRLNAMLYKAGNVDYIPPAENPEILHEATKEDYLRLLTLLCEKTEQEVLLLDFGAMLPGFTEMLMRCDRVYCPMGERGINPYRLQHFRSFLTKSGHEELVERVHCLVLPDCLTETGGLTRLKELLFWGEFGETLRRQIRETGEAYAG